MFVVLKYKDGRITLLNADCAAKNLLLYICSKCGWDNDNSSNAVLDLCDTLGNVKNLHKLGMCSAGTVLKHKETYVPVVIEQSPESTSNDEEQTAAVITKPIPKILLDQSDKLYKTINDNLRKKQSAANKTSRNSAGSGNSLLAPTTGRASPSSLSLSRGKKSLTPEDASGSVPNKSKSRVKSKK